MPFAKIAQSPRLSFDSELTFGQYKGQTIGEVYKIDSPYLAWCLENIEWFKLSTLEELMIEEKADAVEMTNDRYEDWGFDWNEY